MVKSCDGNKSRGNRKLGYVRLAPAGVPADMMQLGLCYYLMFGNLYKDCFGPCSTKVS